MSLSPKETLTASIPGGRGLRGLGFLLASSVPALPSPRNGLRRAFSPHLRSSRQDIAPAQSTWLTHIGKVRGKELDGPLLQKGNRLIGRPAKLH